MALEPNDPDRKASGSPYSPYELHVAPRYSWLLPHWGSSGEGMVRKWLGMREYAAGAREVQERPETVAGRY